MVAFEPWTSEVYVLWCFTLCTHISISVFRQADDVAKNLSANDSGGSSSKRALKGKGKREAREEKANTVDAKEPVSTVDNWSSVLLREPLKTADYA